MLRSVWCMLVFLLVMMTQLHYFTHAAKSKSTTLTPEACLDYGFNSNVLVCSTCEEVGQILGEQSDAKLTCSQCCVADSKNEEKYKKAILEVDKRTLPFLPDIEKVVKDKKKLKLTVRYRMGPPSLQMFKSKDDDEAAETISVQNWTQDLFQEYISAHLVQ